MRSTQEETATKYIKSYEANLSSFSVYIDFEVQNSIFQLEKR
jgi:hypothetical protein